MPGSIVNIVHFHNGSGGGVLSVINNLLKFSGNNCIQNHVIFTINKQLVPEYIPPELAGTKSTSIFYYSPHWNFYYTCKQLAKLLPDKALIVAHDWLELGMASNLGMQNTVIQVLHGDFDYYYELALKHNRTIDAYICISKKMFYSLKRKLPSRQADIFQLNFPVPDILHKSKANECFQIIYYVSDLKEHRKQFHTILKIAVCLAGSPNKYFFTIAGGGMNIDEFFELWPASMKERVNYVGFRSNEEIIALLSSQDIFLLPSFSEGLPVSLVEAMKAGVVPLVTNWDGIMDELVINDVTGYHFNIGAAEEYAACIERLYADRRLLNQLSENCVQQANKLFHPQSNTQKFEDLFVTIAKEKTKKKDAVKAYGSRLDIRWMPNLVVNIIRHVTIKISYILNSLFQINNGYSKNKIC